MLWTIECIEGTGRHERWEAVCPDSVSAYAIWRLIVRVYRHNARPLCGVHVWVSAGACAMDPRTGSQMRPMPSGISGLCLEYVEPWPCKDQEKLEAKEIVCPTKP